MAPAVARTRPSPDRPRRCSSRRPTSFFREEWGAGVLRDRLREAWGAYLAHVATMYTFETTQGWDGLERVYRDVLGGRTPARIAHVVAF
jgi:hypothetical protein